MDFNIKDSLLGKKTETPDQYSADILFRIPRSENRLHYGLDDAQLPFVGYDVWNCYELSFLTDNGLPVSRVLKLIYAADSRFLVESKSLKLYLNAFNMDRFGPTVAEAEKRVAGIIQSDLSTLLETQVSVVLFDSRSEEKQAFSSLQQLNMNVLVPVQKQESIVFSRFVESPELLRSISVDSDRQYAFHSDLLRSNCRVTNQPDWGDLFVRITSRHDIDLASVMEYLVSFRKENHFHEEVVEMIYKRFWDAFQPSELMVAAMYTRRGGIDINPIRASRADLIDEVLVSTDFRVTKTMRQ